VSAGFPLNKRPLQDKVDLTLARCT